MRDSIFSLLVMGRSRSFDTFFGETPRRYSAFYMQGLRILSCTLNQCRRCQRSTFLKFVKLSSSCPLASIEMLSALFGTPPSRCLLRGSERLQFANLLAGVAGLIIRELLRAAPTEGGPTYPPETPSTCSTSYCGAVIVIAFFGIGVTRIPLLSNASLWWCK